MKKPLTFRRFPNKLTVLLWVLFCTFISLNAQAQTLRVTGIIKDNQGDPLIGATVQIKGETRAVITDPNGSYSIEVPQVAGTTLLISYVGFASQEIDAVGKTSIDLTLQPDALNVDDIVITAFGVQKQNRSLGYAISTIKSEDIVKTNTINPITALQGKVAGVNIAVVGSSGVQGSPNITIRGNKSLSKNNQPIFVIDGIVIENNIAEEQNTDYGSQLKNLNPDDYESITILKGAAATSLYGSRGANGAVVITSKKGGKQEGIGLELSHTQEWVTPYAPHIKLQNKYGMGYHPNGFEGGFHPVTGVPNGGVASANSFGPEMLGQEYQSLYKDGKSYYSPQPDSWKELYETGRYMNTNVAFSGGGPRYSYRLSYSNTHNKGIYKNNSFNRNAVSLNATGKLSSWISSDFGFNYANGVVRNPNFSGRWNDDRNVGKALTDGLPRDFDIADFKNNYREEDGAVKEFSYGLWQNFANSLHNADYRNLKRTEDSYLFNLGVNFQLTKWLDFSVRGNYNLYRIFGEEKTYGSGANFEGGHYETAGEHSGNYNGIAMLHGGHSWIDNKLTFDVRITGEVYGNNRSESWSQKVDGLLTPGFFSFSNSRGEVIDNYGLSYPNQMTIGLAAAASLGWDNQVYLEITARNDWASTLLYPSTIAAGQNNFSVFYPSVNASWVFTETFKDYIPSTVISFGKLRASFAQVGLGTSAYYTNTSGFNQSTVRNSLGIAVVTASENSLTTLPEYNLKPEIQQSFEVGADIRFLNDRLGVDFAWYQLNTYNQILTLNSLAFESGVGSRVINAGNIRNRGFELALNATPVRTKDFTWDITANFTRNRSHIVKLHPEAKEYQLAGDYEGVEVWAYEGGDFGVITSQNVRGRYQARDAAGNPIDHPNNGKMVLGMGGTGGGVPVYNWYSEADLNNYNEDYKRTVLGNIQPDFFWGFNSSMYYKGFDLNIQIDGRVGGAIYSSSYALGMGRGNLEESLQYRDKASGGVARINRYTGHTEFDGVIPDAIFNNGEKTTSLATGKEVDLSGMSFLEAVKSGHIEPWKAASYYKSTYGWANNLDNGSVMENTWIAIRDITLGYTFPTKLLEKIRMQKLRIAFSARNVGYIYNGLKGKLNPESIQSNNPWAPFEYGGTPYARNFSFTVQVGF